MPRHAAAAAALAAVAAATAAAATWLLPASVAAPGLTAWAERCQPPHSLGSTMPAASSEGSIEERRTPQNWSYRRRAARK